VLEVPSPGPAEGLNRRHHHRPAIGDRIFRKDAAKIQMTWGYLVSLIVTGMLAWTGSPQTHIDRMRELSLVISYLTAAAGLVWIWHIVGTYYVWQTPQAP